MSGAGLHKQSQVAPLSIPGGFAQGLALLADPQTRPTAIFAGSDEVAIGVIIAARQLGIRVPAQLSVVGIDGHELAEMFGLTTLEQDPRGQGALAVDLVMGELTAGERTPETMPKHAWRPCPVRLVVRSSATAPAH